MSAKRTFSEYRLYLKLLLVIDKYNLQDSYPNILVNKTGSTLKF